MKLPEVLELLISKSARTNKEYQEAVDFIRTLNEGNTPHNNRSYGSNFREAISMERLPYDLSTSFGTPWSAAQRKYKLAYKDADERTEMNLPWVKRYVELRKSGVDHNEALDIVNTELRQAENVPSISGVFKSGYYTGNRKSYEDINPMDLMK